jgi:hypothetical protein
VTEAAVRGQPEAPAPASPRATTRARTGVVAIACFVLLAMPLLVAVVVLHGQQWRPTLDLAWTEMRVRDVGSRHTPLIGLIGRIGVPGPDQGSHPGPASFYALAPFYRLYGASAWALEAAAATVNLAAVGVALWIATRRGGVRLVLATAAILAVLLHFYGPSTLTQAWNPYLPVLWLMVFLLACWSILCDDFLMLPVAVLTGSFCMQTHVPYAGLVAGVGAVTITLSAVSVLRRRDAALGRRLLRWAIGASVLLVLVWIPPLVDQLRHTPGNLSTLADYFRHPPDDPVGARRGVREMLRQMDPWKVLTDVFLRPVGDGEGTRPDTTNPWWPGALLTAVWVGSVVAAARLRVRRLVALDIVIGAAFVLGAVTTSRIFGFLWYYLVMWAWVIGGLMMLAVIWTAAALLGRVLPDDTYARVRAIGVAILIVVMVSFTAHFAVDASDVDVPDPELSATIGKIVRPTAAALRAEGEPDAQYLVTWRDPATLGAAGYALVNELERLGFDVGVSADIEPGATKHRVLDPSEATAEVHLAAGSDIDVWRARADAREIAAVDPRSRAERARYERLRTRVIESLEARGRARLAEHVDESVFSTAFDTRISPHERALLTRMLDIGLPQAVFVANPVVEGTAG